LVKRLKKQAEKLIIRQKTEKIPRNRGILKSTPGNGNLVENPSQKTIHGVEYKEYHIRNVKASCHQEQIDITEFFGFPHILMFPKDLVECKTGQYPVNKCIQHYGKHYKTKPGKQLEIALYQIVS
jgi:hypothetical protein